jgi:hypothetical protein
MTAPATKTDTVTLSLDDLKKLKSRHRPRFNDEQVKRALKYQLEKDCTLDEAAATEGMTGQTLAKRRDELYEKMGLTEEGSEVAKVAQPAPKQAAKPAKPGAKK